MYRAAASGMRRKGSEIGLHTENTKKLPNANNSEFNESEWSNHRSEWSNHRGEIPSSFDVMKKMSKEGKNTGDWNREGDRSGGSGNPGGEKTDFDVARASGRERNKPTDTRKRRIEQAQETDNRETGERPAKIRRVLSDVSGNTSNRGIRSSNLETSSSDQKRSFAKDYAQYLESLSHKKGELTENKESAEMKDQQNQGLNLWLVQNAISSFGDLVNRLGPPDPKG